MRSEGEVDSGQPGSPAHCQGLSPTSSRFDQHYWDAATSAASPAAAPPGEWRWVNKNTNYIVQWSKLIKSDGVGPDLKI